MLPSARLGTAGSSGGSSSGTKRPLPFAPLILPPQLQLHQQDDSPKSGMSLSSPGRASPAPSSRSLAATRLKQRFPQLDVGDHLPVSDSPLKRRRFDESVTACTNIYPGLYIGGDYVSKSWEVLAAHGITHVVNCVSDARPFKQHLRYKNIQLRDSSREELLHVLYDTLEFIDAARDAGGSVLVHCTKGVSRSASIGIAYLMWKEDKPYELVLAAVQDRRSVACPNLGFTCTLTDWQTWRKQVPIRPRLYRLAPHCKADANYLVPKLVVPNGQPLPVHTYLDPRFAFVIHTPQHQLYVWQGAQAHPAMTQAAQQAARLIRKFESTPTSPMLIRQGEEPLELLAALHMPVNGDDNGPAMTSAPAVPLTGTDAQPRCCSDADPMDVDEQDVASGPETPWNRLMQVPYMPSYLAVAPPVTDAGGRSHGSSSGTIVPRQEYDIDLEWFRDAQLSPAVAAPSSRLAA